MMNGRRFPDMERWLKMVRAWWVTVEAAVRMNISPRMLECLLRSFPKYPETE